MTSKNHSDFGGDQPHVMLGLGIQLPWQRFVLFECSGLQFFTFMNL